MFNQVNITIKQSYAMLGILTLPSIVALAMLIIAEASLFSAGAACIAIGTNAYLTYSVFKSHAHNNALMIEGKKLVYRRDGHYLPISIHSSVWLTHAFAILVLATNSGAKYIICLSPLTSSKKDHHRRLYVHDRHNKELSQTTSTIATK
ncbi:MULTISPECIES: hypothetical protein [unclassified Oleiphilus]|uniref:hypothetical protein n=2 Tax=Oleiphilus TaxID=141450 RepID=UPI0007C3022E|nr:MULTISPECIES: hypothetical protein [unclassified Oleiphilus]KZY63839.1 hypothetical protein A3738_01845 [Oleiphilus sp. HI0066]KZY67715.1 hypothetical protein A3738_27645 [Oleiphilus sp. HI0066]